MGAWVLPSAAAAFAARAPRSARARCGCAGAVAGPRVGVPRARRDGSPRAARPGARVPLARARLLPADTRLRCEPSPPRARRARLSGRDAAPDGRRGPRARDGVERHPPSRAGVRAPRSTSRPSAWWSRATLQDRSLGGDVRAGPRSRRSGGSTGPNGAATLRSSVWVSGDEDAPSRAPRRPRPARGRAPGAGRSGVRRGPPAQGHRRAARARRFTRLGPSPSAFVRATQAVPQRRGPLDRARLPAEGSRPAPRTPPGRRLQARSRSRARLPGRRPQPPPGRLGRERRDGARAGARGRRAAPALAMAEVRRRLRRGRVLHGAHRAPSRRCSAPA